MNQDIYLSMDRNGAVPRMEAVQGDTGRSVLCRFADFALVSGDTAACWFERPNGTLFTQGGTVDATEQTVTVALVENGPLTQAGKVKAQLEITRSGSVVSSFVFEIYVEEKISGAATQEDLTWRDEVIEEVESHLTDRFRIIETITLSEETNLISKTFTKPLTDLFIHMNFGSSLTMGTYLSFSDSSIFVNNIAAFNGWHICFNCVNNKGLLTVQAFYTQQDNESTYASQRFRILPNNRINGISLGTGSDSVKFPVGTIIEIYGAEAMDD